MIDMQASLQHHLFEVPIAQRIAQIPPNAQENDRWLEMTPFEGILALITHERTSFPPTLTDQLFICNTTTNSAPIF